MIKCWLRRTHLECYQMKQPFAISGKLLFVMASKCLLKYACYRGGLGQIGLNVARKHPNIRIVLQDLPSVVEESHKVDIIPLSTAYKRLTNS